MLLDELAGLENRALTPTRTRKQAIAEANRRRASRGLPQLSTSTVSDWFNRGSPARDFATLWTLIEVLVEWADPRSRPDQRDQAIVMQVHQRRWKLLWEAARGEPPPLGPAPGKGHIRAEPASTAEPQRLGPVILATFIDRSIEISGMLGRPLAAVARAENRTAWQLLHSVSLAKGEASWPIRHHSHRIGYLIWHDEDDRTGWELAVPDGRWYEGEEYNPEWPYRYLWAPPEKKAVGSALRGAWADPADALLTLADWHYCPRAALTTLFRLVEEGTSADEASRIVHILPAVGERLVRRALRARRRLGRPLLDQVDDFLPVRESDWEAGLV